MAPRILLHVFLHPLPRAKHVLSHDRPLPFKPESENRLSILSVTTLHMPQVSPVTRSTDALLMVVMSCHFVVRL